MRKAKGFCRWLSAWVALALLFTQLATAVYACPQPDASAHVLSSTLGPDCEGTHPVSGMDLEDPLLCKASCEQNAQTAGTLVGLDAAQVAILLYLAPPTSNREPVSHAAWRAHPAFGQTPPGWPPLYLFHRILRN